MKNRKLFVIFLVVLLVVIFSVAWYFIKNQQEEILPINEDQNQNIQKSLEEPLILSEEEMQKLIESTIPTEDAKPALTEEELQELMKTTIPSEDAESSLSEEELQGLIEATTPKGE
jgi:cell division protein YceG involved in septum cleavage